jgi:GxxExxY protein
MISNDIEDLDELTERVIGAAIAVHTSLGPGLLESVYQNCLAIHLRHLNLPFELEARFPIFYLGERVRGDLKVDVLVDRRLIVEVKAVERLHPVFKAQVVTYLKLSNCPAGLLLNFNATSLRSGLHRLDRPDIYATKLEARRLRSK